MVQNRFTKECSQQQDLLLDGKLHSLLSIVAARA